MVNERVKTQTKLYSYYIGDESVLTYLENALSLTFDSDDLSEFQKNWINITKKCVDQLAIVYRDPATRSIVMGDDVNEELDEYYNNLLPVNINTIDKAAHRNAKLCNTSLTRVYFDKGIKYSVLPSYLYNVKVSDSDPYKMTEVSYTKYFGNEPFVVVWTDTEHYKVPLLKYRDGYFTGDKVPVVKGGDLLNPYGIIPYAVLRLEEQNDFWGTGLLDLINTNEQINVMLTELINEQIIMGTAGTTLAVNLGLGFKKNDGTTGYKKVRTGRKHPIVVENVQTNDAQPSLEHVTTNPFITEIRETVDWHIKMIAMSKGLNPNSFLAEVQDTSGFSKVLDGLEQLEIRRDDIEPCRMYEDQRFEITRIVNNVHEQTPDKSKYGLKKIPEDAYLMVDFAEIEAPKTIEETVQATEYKLKYNLTNVIDLARENNPDLTDEELEKKIQRNKEINDKYLKQEIKEDGRQEDTE